jgi:hypothetical protein
MVLKDILAISGESGLFKFIAQGKNAIIVEHLETKKRSSAFASAKVSSLDEISVFTDEEDMPLGKIFDLISEKEKGGPAIDFKSDSEKLKAWFAEVLPQYDREKVYVSDIRKMAHWYNILHALKLLVKEEPEKPEEPVKSEEPAVKDTSVPGESASVPDPEKKKSATAKKVKSAAKGEPSSKKKTPKPGNK